MQVGLRSQQRARDYFFSLNRESAARAAILVGKCRCFRRHKQCRSPAGRGAGTIYLAGLPAHRSLSCAQGPGFYPLLPLPFSF